MRARLDKARWWMVLGLVVPVQAYAQTVDTLRLENPIVSFTRPGHMGVSPDGIIYIPDRDKNTIVRVSVEGLILSALGSSGFSEGQFDEPSDVDPALGLVINVADKQNGRIQRFTKEFRFVESIPISDGPRDLSDETDPSFRSGQAQFQAAPDGRPSALSSSPTDDLFVIEESSGLVLRLDRDRRNVWWIGEAGQGSGVLRMPVDLVFHDQKLFVADADCACIQMYDQFGTHIQTISRGLLPDILSVTATTTGILVVLESGLLEYSTAGRRLREYATRPEVPLLDAAQTSGSWIILTQAGLFIFPIN